MAEVYTHVVIGNARDMTLRDENVMGIDTLQPSRFVNVRAARMRFGDRVDRLVPFFDKVDPLADRLVEALDATAHPDEGWAMIEAALAHGIASVSGAGPEMRAFFTHAEHVPVWVDWATLDRAGSVLFRTGPVGGLVLGAKSLVLGYASPGGNKPLVLSGRLREQAARRLNETARFVQATCEPGGLRRFAPGYRIALKVRLMHARVRFMIHRSGKWNREAWGAPINQHDMAATTLLFSMVLLDGVRELGMRVTPDEADDYMQLWRYSGHLMGVDAEILATSEAEARRLADLIAATTGEPDDDSRALVRALMESGGAPNAQTTRTERALAERRLHFGYAMCRELVGDDLADKLGVERTSWRLAPRILRRVVRATEAVRTSVPTADARAIAAGQRYWSRVIEIGLQGATAEFRMPKSLAA
jgi:hypothetical protein